MKYYLLFLPSLLALSGCSSSPGSHAIAREAVRPGVEPECFQIKDDDAQMSKAVGKARKTVRTFIAAVQHRSPTQKDFEVKKPFVQGDIVEHLWLSDITFSGNRFHGRVDNIPRKIKGVKMGDRVSVNPGEITDWAYVDKGYLVGGYTIRVLYGELSQERKEALENEAGFRIAKQ